MEELAQLVKDACTHPPGSASRQRLLTQIIQRVQPRLWRNSTPGYEDALQQTWFFFCKNLCASYDPERASVVTWLNNHLRWRLKDLQTTQAEDRRRFIVAVPNDESNLDPVVNIPANPYVPPMLEAIQTWAETDPEGELKSVHIQGHPSVTCQLLILRRLPPETSWQKLSKEFGIAVPTLSSFYQRQCLPRMRKFGESEGYV
jgi:hypothetical protein